MAVEFEVTIHSTTGSDELSPDRVIADRVIERQILAGFLHDPMTRSSDDPMFYAATGSSPATRSSKATGTCRQTCIASTTVVASSSAPTAT
jgi:hypothetical protein